MAKEEKGTFDGEEENGGGAVNAELDAELDPDGGGIELMRGRQPDHEMDHELLDEVSAVGNAGDEGGPRDRDPAER